MYQVSPAYLNILFGNNIKRRRIVGSIGTASSVISSFTENDILKESFSYSAQCVGSADINLGGVFVSTLKMIFLPSVASQIESGSWANKVIKVSVGLEIYEDYFIDVPLQDFVVAEATKSALGIEVTCYDYMTNFDKRVNYSTATGKAYNFLSEACQKCGVTMAQTEAQLYSFPNGQENLTLSPENDISTWRDVVSWCALTLGGFAVINRENELEIRKWKNTSDLTLDINARFTGGTWSDFVTKYTGISYVSTEDETYHRYNVMPDNGLTMKLGQNPFFQTGGIATVRSYCMAILESLQSFHYTPFKCQTLADVFLDLGDVIQFTQGISSTCLGCVMKIDYTYVNGATIEGFGKNPAIFGAQSKTDKNMSGLMNRSSSQEMVFIKDTNLEAVEQVVETGTTNPSVHLAHLQINPTKETNVEINTRVIYNALLEAGSNDLLEGTNMSIRYVLANEEIKAVPFNKTYVTNLAKDFTYDIDHTILDYQTILKIQGGQMQILDVWLDLEAPADDWTLSIPIEGIEVVVKGQGLATEQAWDGLIVCEDSLSRLSIAAIGGIKELEDSVSVSLVLPENISPNESISRIGFDGVAVRQISEQVGIYLTSISHNLVTAQGDNIMTADGNDNIVTKG